MLKRLSSSAVLAAPVPARAYHVTGIKLTTLPAPRNGARAIAQVTPIPTGSGV
jgi:hypothetical protein